MSTPRPPRKQQAPPPVKGALYCHTCGRVMSPTKPTQPSTTPQKYCSTRCQRTRLRPPSSTTHEPIERRIERVFVRMMMAGQSGAGAGGIGGKVVVQCGEVEGVVFPRDQGDVGGEGDTLERGRNKGEEEEEEEASDDDEGGGVPLNHNDNSNNDGNSVTDRSSQRRKPSVEEEEADPRKAGMERARNREMVRQAARRLVAFGAPLGAEGGGQVRAVEAVQGGRVVESSFAKGEWGVRWRE